MITYCENAVKLIGASNGNAQIKIAHTGQILNVAVNTLEESESGELACEIAKLKAEGAQFEAWTHDNA